MDSIIFDCSDDKIRVSHRFNEPFTLSNHLRMIKDVLPPFICQSD